MPRMRLVFDKISLYENEEAGRSHVALYGTVTDAHAVRLASFVWNNRGVDINEPGDFSLGVDPHAPNVVDFDLTGVGTVSVAGFAADDREWPDAAFHENDLGAVSTVIDTGVPGTLGSMVIGPSTTDNGNAGFAVALCVRPVPPPAPAELRLTFHQVQVLKDEEYGDTHLALYVHALAPAQGGVPAMDQELLRWNNGNQTVEDPHSYPMTNSAVTTTLRLPVGGPTQIWVEGWAKDDLDWPTAADHENNLGSATILLDPVDPASLGRLRLGPSCTDNGNPGYLVDLDAEVLPGGSTPALKIVGIELTQAVQRFRSMTGPDNSAPLVAGKDTLARIYIDSGTDPAAEAGGLVRDVRGELVVDGAEHESLLLGGFAARPLTELDRQELGHTLNFRIPGSLCHGPVTMTARVWVVGSTSAPEQISTIFRPVRGRNILRMPIGTPTVPSPTTADYDGSVSQIIRMYPLPTSPTQAIAYWVHPVFPNWITTRNLALRTPNGDEDLSGMNDLLDDLEDLQEDFEDWLKLMGVIPMAVPMNREGIATENQAFAHPGLESIAHELGHLYGLKHAPCPPAGSGRLTPEDVDDDFVPPDGHVGDVGVDVANAAVHPADLGDLMSYCRPRWISAYDWQKLVHRFQEV